MTIPSPYMGQPPLRVALDTTYAGVNPTGVGLYSARLAAELKRQSARYDLNLRCYGPACSLKRAHQSLIGTFQEWPTYTHGLLPARLLAFDPQIVHSTSHIGPIWGPGRLIVTVHDLIFMRSPEDYQAGWLALTRLLLPQALRRATAVIADSQATKDEVAHFFGVRKGKIVVIYPGIDSVPPGARQKWPADVSSRWTKVPYVLCLGPWVRRKNLPVVMKAFSLLATRLPDVDLVLTGDRPRGMKGYTAQELLSHMPVEHRHRVRFVGYVSNEEKQALISNAAVLCYPSRLEGFGLPPLEAMAQGTPVVAASSPAVVEVTGGAAVIIDPDDTMQWAAAIERLVRLPEAAQELRAEGLQRSALFTWQRCAEQTVRLYRRVASRHARA